MRGQNRKCIFVAIQVTLYGVFLLLDIVGRNIILSNRIKLAVVVLCFLYVAIIGVKDRRRKHILLIYALAFTLVADMFILLSDYYLYGVLAFIIVQQLYGMRITEFNNREKILNSPNSLIRDLILRLLYQGAFAALVGIILWGLAVNVDALLGASIFYFISFCTNVVRAIKLSIQYGYKGDIRYFTIGMVLFLLCDINVGLFNLSAFLPLGPSYEIVYNASSILMWTFYAPSQVLIALSGHNN